MPLADHGRESATPRQTPPKTPSEASSESDMDRAQIAATRRLVGGSVHVFILIHRQGDLEQTSGKGFTRGGSRQGLKSKTVKLEQTNCKGDG